MADLRKVSLGLTGSQPANLPTIPRSRPTAPKVESPRDGGSMSDGSTGGNFALSSMTDRPNNSGAKGTEAGVDAAAAAQASYLND